MRRVRSAPASAACRIGVEANGKRLTADASRDCRPERNQSEFIPYLGRATRRGRAAALRIFCNPFGPVKEWVNGKRVTAVTLCAVFDSAYRTGITNSRSIEQNPSSIGWVARYKEKRLSFCTGGGVCRQHPTQRLHGFCGEYGANSDVCSPPRRNENRRAMGGAIHESPLLSPICPSMSSRATRRPPSFFWQSDEKRCVAGSGRRSRG